MENPIDFLKRPIAVVGMGMSGEAARRLLLLNRVKKEDLVTFDDKPDAADYCDPAKMLEERGPRTLVVSPGVPLAKDWIQEFQDHGGLVTSELALGLHFLDRERVVGVTGSVGKSTTVSLLEAGLRAFSPESFVGGNIGRPLADYVSDFLERKRRRAPWVVLELSSYQLENCGHLQCELSALTYLTGNHLDRYPSRDAYYETKWELVRRTSKAVVLNSHGGDLRKFAKGRRESAELLWTDQNDEELAGYELQDAKLLGAHNQDNIAVAVKLAREAGWPAEAIEGMKNFPGLPHRMENLGLRQRIRFVNDSKATTMESVKTAALGLYEQMDRKMHLVLLLGGKDKNLPWGELSELKKIQKLRPVFFGECGGKARTMSGLEGEVFPTLRAACEAMHSFVSQGDTVLLSPGGTSLDEFKNFEERGRFFAEQVKKQYP
jgi:UDP-N-acetylmuramoylalanine--D-glutamate ligase